MNTQYNSDNTPLIGTDDHTGMTSRLVQGVFSRNDTKPAATKTVDHLYVNPEIRLLEIQLQSASLGFPFKNNYFFVDMAKKRFVITTELRTFLSKNPLKNYIIEELFNFRGTGTLVGWTITG